jgi:hypothetical protein
MQWLSNRVLCPLDLCLEEKFTWYKFQIEKIKNKKRQIDVGFYSSQTQMIKNIFTVAPTLMKVPSSMAHNDLGLPLAGK